MKIMITLIVAALVIWFVKLYFGKRYRIERSQAKAPLRESSSINKLRSTPELIRLPKFG